MFSTFNSYLHVAVIAYTSYSSTYIYYLVACDSFGLMALALNVRKVGLHWYKEAGNTFFSYFSCQEISSWFILPTIKLGINKILGPYDLVILYCFHAKIENLFPKTAPLIYFKKRHVILKQIYRKGMNFNVQCHHQPSFLLAGFSWPVPIIFLVYSAFLWDHIFPQVWYDYQDNMIILLLTGTFSFHLLSFLNPLSFLIFHSSSDSFFSRNMQADTYVQCKIMIKLPVNVKNLNITILNIIWTWKIRLSKIKAGIKSSKNKKRKSIA